MSTHFNVGDKFKIVKEPSEVFPDLAQGTFVDNKVREVLSIADTIEEMLRWYKQYNLPPVTKDLRKMQATLPILFYNVPEYNVAIPVPAVCCQKVEEKHLCNCPTHILINVGCQCKGL